MQYIERDRVSMLFVPQASPKWQTFAMGVKPLGSSNNKNKVRLHVCNMCIIYIYIYNRERER